MIGAEAGTGLFRIGILDAERPLVAPFHARLVKIGLSHFGAVHSGAADGGHSGLTVTLTASEVAGAVQKDAAGAAALLAHELIEEGATEVIVERQKGLTRFFGSVECLGGGTGATLGDCLARAVGGSATIHRRGCYIVLHLSDLAAALGEAQREAIARSLVARLPTVGPALLDAFDKALAALMVKRKKDEKVRLDAERRAVEADRFRVEHVLGLLNRLGLTEKEFAELLQIYTPGKMTFAESGGGFEECRSRARQVFGAMWEADFLAGLPKDPRRASARDPQPADAPEKPADGSPAAAPAGSAPATTEAPRPQSPPGAEPGSPPSAKRVFRKPGEPK